MIKVAFGITQYARGSNGTGIDGIGHYSKELINSLIKNKEFSILPFSFGQPTNKLNLKQPAKMLAPFTLEITKGFFLPSYGIQSIKKEKINIIHATDHLIPIVKDVPMVATIMDAIPLSNPEYFDSSLSNLKTRLWKHLTKKADHIITISEFSKTEISKWFGIKEEKISVIPLGVDSRFFEIIKKEDREKITTKFDIPKDFFLSVGTLQPRKNINRVLNAFKMLPDEIKKSMPLVIVGRNGWDTDDLNIKIQEAISQGWCIRLNWVTDYELRALLQSAKGLIFPSLIEGFGLPVLEAFASRTPVITSNTTSLPEASNGAALLINPYSELDLLDAIYKIIQGGELIEFNVDRGYKHALQMTWEMCAIKTTNVYQMLASN